MRARALSLLCCVLAVGCSPPVKPELLACMRASEGGGCVDRRTELVVGRSYIIIARGEGLPERATLVLERFEDGRAIVLAERPVSREGRAHFENPLTLPRVGTYRVSLRDTEGRARLSTNLRAPTPSVWREARETPAPSPEP